MLKFNLSSLAAYNVPVIDEVNNTLTQRGLTCLSLTQHPDSSDDSAPFSRLMANELNKLVDTVYGEIRPDNADLRDDTKGVMLLRGGDPVASIVMNPHWKQESMGFVLSLEHILPGNEELGDLSNLLKQCAEAFILGYIELSMDREILDFYDEGGMTITLVSMCPKGDSSQHNSLLNLGFKQARYYWGHQELAEIAIPFEKVLEATNPDSSDTDSVPY
jgi:hypothetical protein